ncbi:hypothetical protein [Acetobacter garciniae]|uniref:Uncharacterized protein n=1 Tax=Acetobacter garciniae TaxID=2817435 RepID=A0A939KR05_9PROT|nr:hypothetical protein [Acetobacter garciniae]MBO1326112.1 hypothetical protein [Acetobacter garciniae]
MADKAGCVRYVFSNRRGEQIVKPKYLRHRNENLRPNHMGVVFFHHPEKLQDYKIRCNRADHLAIYFPPASIARRLVKKRREEKRREEKFLVKLFSKSFKECHFFEKRRHPKTFLS